MKKVLSLCLLIMLLVAPALTSFPFDRATIKQPQTETVYVTKTGEKYHRSECHYLRSSKIETTKQQAIKNGYSACSKCKP